MDPSQAKEMQSITTIEALDSAIQLSKTQPLFIFKHSSACIVSSEADEEIEKYIENSNALPVYKILVIENRPLSNHVSQFFSVKHASPQLLLVKKEKCIWSANQSDITAKSMQAATKKDV